MGIFKSKNESTRSNGGKTIIAEGCHINGEIVDLKGSLHIDGRVDGIIESDYDVSIGVTGQVKGLVKARSIVLSGTLDGKIVCEKIDILAKGKLIGELVCNDFTVETGGKFIGQSHEMTESGMIVSLPETFEELDQLKKIKQLSAQIEDSDVIESDHKEQN